ncbi:MAG: Nucleotide-binding protein implicated in inhibition of septum formation [candidate division TM6 bacterium GW2011_GWF2_30_66]|jgi:septum formation protein|nr:MAG: Nucleotide-binding protein implicated in inhibition of septum formation [candidate division TM6 bacterium GW2011_GWF2_30_66]
MENILYLGSKSQARRQLLKDAQIKFVLVGQDADESLCDLCETLCETVSKIALYKMEHVVLPDGHHEGEICFVLTADTLTQNRDGSLSGKPTDRAHAISMIKSARAGAVVGTAFCLDKKIFRAGKWTLERRIEKYVDASYELDIQDEWIDIYLEKSFGSVASGAVAIEGYGEQFLKTINGSHSAIVGLPMFELRVAMQEFGFFKF